MQIVFCTLCALVIAYVVFVPRKIDFFTVAAFSSIVYLYPALLGEYTKNGMTSAVSFTTYACICAWELVLLVMIVVNSKYRVTWKRGKKDRNRRPQTISNMKNTRNNRAVFILAIVECVLCVYTIQKYGGLFSSMRKVEMLAEGDKYTSYLKYIALFCFVYSFTNKGKLIYILRCLSLLFIGYTFLLGHRSFAVIGIISIAVSYFKTNGKIRLSTVIRKNKTLVLLIMAAALFFLFIKGVYAALFAGNYELVLRRLSDPNYYYRAFLNSEASGILSNLQNVITNHTENSILNYLLSFLTLIPFVGGRFARALGYEPFSDILNSQFNDRLDEGFGIGSTFIGEAYSAGGILWVFVVAILVLCICKLLNSKVLTTSDGIMNTFWTVSAAYFTFYIYRNSLIYLLILMRANLYILLVLLVLRAIRLRKKA